MCEINFHDDEMLRRRRRRHRNYVISTLHFTVDSAMSQVSAREKRLK